MLDTSGSEYRAVSRSLVCDIVESVAAAEPAFWQRALLGDPEGYALQLGCEHAGRGAFHLEAAVVRDGTRTLAVCPLFRAEYRLSTSLQGTARKICDVTDRWWPSFAYMRLLGFGSPYADICALAVDPDVDATSMREVLRLLVERVVAYGREQNTSLFAVKDLPDDRYPAFAEALAAFGFTRMNGLPNCAVDLPFDDFEGYLATLSRPTRKDIRRKLKSAGNISLEIRTAIHNDPIRHEIRRLYESTRDASQLDYGDFETLPENYFEAVSRSMGDRAVFMLYRIDGTLAAFNLLLVGDDRIVDKFLGMRRDLAEVHNLYVYTWMQNIRYCIARGVPSMQFGPTAYGLKMRFGCRLQDSGIWFHHTGRIANSILRFAAPFAAFDRLDPELAGWRKAKAARARNKLQKQSERAAVVAELLQRRHAESRARSSRFARPPEIPR